ncbi:MAG: DUF1727 domain-containing protein, partial [Eggerthellaceae bacterium]|nr:DUF1727 domain-containing protein [Eggerthellaceae bacterium]
MSFGFTLAKAVSALSTQVLRHVFRRPAGNFPGKIALYLDKNLLAHLRDRMEQGSILVVGTNGKTSTTLMLDYLLDISGKKVCCNKTGANLDSGVATALLQIPKNESGKRVADWGVFECDEMWLVRILPQLQSKYVVLTNLFVDQTDRFGDISNIRKSIVSALKQSPQTTLIYNADDPNSHGIADAVDNPKIAFGVEKRCDADEPQAFKQACPRCGKQLEYSMVQYEQIGKYACSCGFASPACDYKVTNPRVSDTEVSFHLSTEHWKLAFWAPHGALYMIYNMGLFATVGLVIGCDKEAIDKTMKDFDAHNGRAQRAQVGNHPVFINLTKNIAGLNQNIDLVCKSEGRYLKETGSSDAVVAVFINNKEGDGFDASWVDSVAFEKLAPF